jgi:hypothetical protein
VNQVGDNTDKDDSDDITDISQLNHLLRSDNYDTINHSFRLKTGD